MVGEGRAKVLPRAEWQSPKAESKDYAQYNSGTSLRWPGTKEGRAEFGA